MTTAPHRPMTNGQTAATAKTHMFASLAVRNYRIFVPGQVFSMVGLWTQRIAQDWAVLELTGSATMVGIATTMQFLPTLIFGLPAGLVADRFNKRRVLLATVSTLGLCAAVLGALCLTGTVALWHIFTVAFITGTAASFDNPTRQAFVHEMVGGPTLRNAVSLNAAVSQLGAMAGPALSATIIAAFGTGWSFVTSAATYVVVFASFIAIRRSQLHIAAPLPRSRGQMRQAIVEIRRRPELLWPLVLAGIGGFFLTNFPVSLAAYAKDWDLGAGGYGFFTTSLAAGSLIGALLSARRPGTRLRMLIALTLGVGVAQIVAAAMPVMLALGALMVVTGLVATPFRIAANTHVQLAASDEMRGRVMGVFMLVILGTAAGGGPLLGYIAEHVGPCASLAFGGVALMVAAVLVGARLVRINHTPVRRELSLAASRLRHPTRTSRR